MISKGYNEIRYMIEYRYGILSQLISEIDNYYQKTFAQFQKEALDLAKQNSSGDFEVYYTILQDFDSEDERISSLCKEVRKILFCSIFSYYEGCINAIIKYYKIETEAQQVQKLYDAISRTYEKRYLVNDLDIEANLLDYVNNFCRLLRNYFMHGDLSDNIIKKKLDCYVRNNDGVKLLDNYFIEIESKDFLFKSLDCMKTILIKIESAFCFRVENDRLQLERGKSLVAEAIKLYPSECPGAESEYPSYCSIYVHRLLLKAEQLYIPLAKRGNAEAQMLLADLYLSAFEIPNTKKGMFWLKKAVMQNYKPAIKMMKDFR